MENSPIVLVSSPAHQRLEPQDSRLSQAHNHARSALLETRRSNPVAASEEHDLAATEFATAANGTSDSEVIETLA